MTRRIAYLEEDDWVVLRHDLAQVFNAGKPVTREIRTTALSGAMIGKGNHRHFMLKEMHEHPEAVGATLRSYLDPATRAVSPPALPFDWKDVPRLTITACGTAYYAAQIGKYWFEKLARLPVETDIGSEFRYREAPMPAGGVCMAVSQSGETADTLAAIRYARSQGQKILSIVNVQESAMARESDVIVPTHAGPEMSVASTKAFTAQLVVLLTLAISAGRARGILDAAREAELVEALIELPSRLAEALGSHEAIAAIANKVAEARDVLYLGRGTSYPIALEGALKLKELSYIHAEGYPAGELKHGPIALIADDVPVVFVAPSDELADKIASAFEQVHARGGKPILFSDAAGIARLGSKAFASLCLPDVDPVVAPILYAVPVQMLAYYAALAKGTDIDQPRNLAKSVVVE